MYTGNWNRPLSELSDWRRMLRARGFVRLNGSLYERVDYQGEDKPEITTHCELQQLSSGQVSIHYSIYGQREGGECYRASFNLNNCCPRSGDTEIIGKKLNIL